MSRENIAEGEIEWLRRNSYDKENEYDLHVQMESEGGKRGLRQFEKIFPERERSRETSCCKTTLMRNTFPLAIWK